MATKETVFTQGPGNKSMTVVREFDAPIAQVWDAWTKSEILEQWWAPKPYKAVTQSMDFREGGAWVYIMQAPDGSGTLCKESYEAIDTQVSIKNLNSFINEDGSQTPGFPVMHWHKQFSTAGDATTVTVDITFDKEEDLKQIVQMGFKEGFTMGLDNLDELLSPLTP